MAIGNYLFTSESVSMGHPDKLADQISDGILDAFIDQDPQSRVACETLVTTGLAMIAGEATSNGSSGAVAGWPQPSTSCGGCSSATCKASTAHANHTLV